MTTLRGLVLGAQHAGNFACAGAVGRCNVQVQWGGAACRCSVQVQRAGAACRYSVQVQVQSRGEHGDTHCRAWSHMPPTNIGPFEATQSMLHLVASSQTYHHTGW